MKACHSARKNIVASISAIALCATLATGMTGCASNENSSASSEASSSSSASQASQSSTSTTEQKDPASQIATGQNGVSITPDQALDKALSYAKLKKSEIENVTNKIDVDDGVTVYEIDFIGPDNVEYEFEVNANSGEIISFDSEAVD